MAPALAGAERRSAEKELQSIERRLAKIESEVAAVHARMAAHHQSDYAGLGTIGDELSALESEAAEREERWLELSELLE